MLELVPLRGDLVAAEVEHLQQRHAAERRHLGEPVAVQVELEQPRQLQRHAVAAAERIAPGDQRLERDEAAEVGDRAQLVVGQVDLGERRRHRAAVSSEKDLSLNLYVGAPTPGRTGPAEFAEKCSGCRIVVGAQRWQRAARRGCCTAFAARREAPAAAAVIWRLTRSAARELRRRVLPAELCGASPAAGPAGELDGAAAGGALDQLAPGYFTHVMSPDSALF